MSALSLWRDAIAQMASPAWRKLWAMALALGVVIGVGAARYLAQMNGGSPDIGAALIVLFGAIFLVLAGNALSVAALRIALDSDRPVWRADGSWWLYFLVSIIAFIIPDMFAPVGTSIEDVAGLGINALLFVAVSVLVLRWLAAIAAEPVIAGPGSSLARLSACAVPLAIALLPVAGLNIASDFLLTESMATLPGASVPRAAFIFGLVFAPLTMAQLALAAAVYRQTQTVEPVTARD